MVSFACARRFLNIFHPDVIDFITISRTCGFVCRRTLFIRFYFLYFSRTRKKSTLHAPPWRFGPGSAVGEGWVRGSLSVIFGPAVLTTRVRTLIDRPERCASPPPRPFRSAPSAVCGPLVPHSDIGNHTGPTATGKHRRVSIPTAVHTTPTGRLLRSIV